MTDEVRDPSLGISIRFARAFDAEALQHPPTPPASTTTPAPFTHEPSPLDVETPRFAGTPHAWIQWKGTDVCADIHCACGCHSHYDGDFMYFVKCPQCGKVWEVGTHVTLHEPTRAVDLDTVAEAVP